MRMNHAQALSNVEHFYDHATDQGQTYYNAIVNFLGVKESNSMELSGLEKELEKRGSASLHPLDTQLNIPSERYSLEIRRRVAENAAKSSFDETLATIKKTTGANIHKRQVEELAQRGAQDFDAFYV